jgi:hypothetical protein
MNAKDRLLAQAALLANAQEETPPDSDAALIRSDLEGRARFYMGVIHEKSQRQRAVEECIALGGVEWPSGAVERLLSEVPPSCWQCEEPLGTTEACLTCAAKRAEDRAKVKT